MDDFLHVIQLALHLGAFVGYFDDLLRLQIQLLLLGVEVGLQSLFLLLLLLQLLGDSNLLTPLLFQLGLGLEQLLLLLHSLFHGL